MPLPVIYIAAGMLFIGVAPLPYAYYTLLRLVVTGVFAWAAFICYERKNQSIPWVFGLLALLFNPIVKIHLSKELWVFIDVGAAVFLLAMKGHIRQHTGGRT